MQFNQGTAAAAPAFPAFTTTRTPLGFLFVPANATNVDTALTTINGNAKLIDARNVRTLHVSRLFAEDHAQTSLTNPTGLTSVLGSTKPCPANSLNVGDTFTIDWSLTYTNNQNASTFQVEVLGFGSTLMNLTFASLATSAFQRQVTGRIVCTVAAIGSGTTTILRNSTAAVSGTGTGVAGESDVPSNLPLTALDSTAAHSFDLQAKITTSSSAATVVESQFSITKHPAQ